MDIIEYRVEQTDSGYCVIGPALPKASYFPEENAATALARHLIGRKGGVIVRVAANGNLTREIVDGRLSYTPSKL
jgi:hypothetical protein